MTRDALHTLAADWLKLLVAWRIMPAFIVRHNRHLIRAAVSKQISHTIGLQPYPADSRKVSWPEHILLKFACNSTRLSIEPVNSKVRVRCC